MAKPSDMENALTLLKGLKDLSSGKDTQSVVPTMQVDKDSFASFTSGVAKGWPFFLAMASIAFWLIQSIFGINSTLAQHDSRIMQSAEAVKGIEAKIDIQTISGNEIIRRLDNLQKDLEILKGK